MYLSIFPGARRFCAVLFYVIFEVGRGGYIYREIYIYMGFVLFISGSARRPGRQLRSAAPFAAAQRGPPP